MGRPKYNSSSSFGNDFLDEFFQLNRRLPTFDEMESHDKKLKREKEIEKAKNYIQDIEVKNNELLRTRDSTNRVNTIPFLEEKKVKITNSGDLNSFAPDDDLSTNRYDSLAKYGAKTNMDIRDALGLPALESNVGLAKLMEDKRDEKGNVILNKKGKPVQVHARNEDGTYVYTRMNNDKLISPVMLLSNWQYSQFKFANNPYKESLNAMNKNVPRPQRNSYENDSLFQEAQNEYFLKAAKFLKGQENYRNSQLKDFNVNEHPIENAFKYYKKSPGTYNSGKPNQEKVVRELGTTLFNSPEVQKWWNEGGYKWYDGKNYFDDNNKPKQALGGTIGRKKYDKGGKVDGEDDNPFMFQLPTMAIDNVAPQRNFERELQLRELQDTIFSVPTQFSNSQYLNNQPNLTQDNRTSEQKKRDADYTKQVEQQRAIEQRAINNPHLFMIDPTRPTINEQNVQQEMAIQQGYADQINFAPMDAAIGLGLDKGIQGVRALGKVAGQYKKMPKGQNTSLIGKPNLQEINQRSMINDIADGKISPEKFYSKAEIEKLYPNLDGKLQSTIQNEIIPRYISLAKQLNYSPKEISKLEKNLLKAAGEIEPFVFKDFGKNVLGNTEGLVPGISTRYNPNDFFTPSIAIHEGGHAFDNVLKLNVSITDEILGNKMFDIVPKNLQLKIDNYLHRAFPAPSDVKGHARASINIGEKRNLNRELRYAFLDHFKLSENSINAQNTLISSLTPTDN